MTAPPREPTPEPCVNCGKARSDHYIVNFADGPQISGMTWICPGSVYDAAPASSADQDQNGGQGHEAYVHCSLGALPLESGNAREATCLNTEPSARTGTDTQQGQLGANAGSISAPPTSTPAAQPAEPPATDVDDECERLFWSFKAKSDPTQTQTPLSERDAFKRTVRLILLAATYAINKELRATVERQAREIADKRAMLQNTKRDWVRLAHLADKYKWQVRDTCTRAERAEAERDALRECVLAADVMRAGYSVMWGERPTSTLDAYDAARAKVKP